MEKSLGGRWLVMYSSGGNLQVKFFKKLNQLVLVDFRLIYIATKLGAFPFKIVQDFLICYYNSLTFFYNVM